MTMGRCASCGVSIPDGQRLCSMCYGDPFYGRDGYYLSYLKKLYEDQALAEELWAWEQASEDDLLDLGDDDGSF